ncbi:MAG: 1-deoxy-D-xylulose-5-phosphate synthase [Clostridia bacterium 41_269]|nr:MAG: 1-deoxy-D-xylulose-5-phosphate synthase [Clostridia bacterium 41_269]
MEFLKKIESPHQIRNMTVHELEKLAEEIRQIIINTVSKTGGHLASNLGAVELTLALHAVFNTPEDKIIWDVGHQCYTHKLITGRRDKFDTLRCYGGLSGFPKREESIYDVFNTGHASTSISAALGIALARDIKGEKYKVIAVIGDGALTGGMAFEALNYAGHLGKDLIVVLNDNKMSIDKNVGALSSYLSRLRTDPMYFKGKEEIENLLKKLPHGSTVLKLADKIKDSIKYLVVPGMLFEELGFTYLGPIDGHNINAMKAVFNNAKSLKGPVLVHVITQKGKGYEPAEDKPDTFHGIGPFNVSTGTSSKKNEPPSYTSVFGHALSQIAEERPDLVAITAAMPGGTGLDIFQKNFPDRYFDVGIAEQNAVTMAAGLAVGGLKPVVAVYSTFLQRAYDQIIHDVCMQKLPVVFAMDRAGIVGEDGETHQGVFDISYMRHIPNMVVMSPKDEEELRHMLFTAVEYEKGPISIRYPRGHGVGVPLSDTFVHLPIGKAEVLLEGSDIAFLAVGNQVYTALKAAESLKKEGVRAAVVNCRFIKPMDEDLVCEMALKIKRIATIEENVLLGGFGSAVLEVLSNKGINNIRLVRIGLPDKFIEHGKADLLREKYGLSAEKVIEKIKQNFPELLS